MKNAQDRNWDLIGDALAAEASGKSPRLFASRRTLFGIPSALDQELAALSEANTAFGHTSSESSKRTVSSARTQMPSRVEHPLDPVFDEHSRVLILGTMPSPRSRETGFYYNHPQNRFWRVMAALFDDPVPETNEDKEQLVLQHGIALWDVLASCTIQGASDGTIADCIPNDIASVVAKAPIEAIFCTGAKAFELYQKYVAQKDGTVGTVSDIPVVRLPSTSPANAATSLDQLIEAYQAILPYAISKE